MIPPKIQRLLEVKAMETVDKLTNFYTFQPIILQDERKYDRVEAKLIK
jgi:hypothetical protein